MTCYTTRTTCRSCHSAALQPIVSLGTLYVSGFVTSSAEADRCARAPLDLVLCLECLLLQLRHTVRPELLYRQYWYRSVINGMMRDALADLAQTAERVAGLRAGDLVLDIGCNDGTLLGAYQTPGLQRIGFEPARNLVDEARRHATHVFNDFFHAGPFLRRALPKAKVITSIAMFYDLEDPPQFVQDLVRCLAEDGLWMIQMAYLPSMLAQTAFDNICHEHLGYYSLTSLGHLLERFHLRIVDAQLNDVNGGSLRVLVKRADCPAGDGDALDRVKALAQREQHLQLENPAVYQAFAARVAERKEAVRTFIRREVQRGKRVYVYGASTKGNTLLQYCGLDHTWVLAAAERSRDKWGQQTVGTWIPIISEERMRRDHPDYLLVLPWHFLREFMERERAYLASGGKLIVPLPHFQVLP